MAQNAAAYPLAAPTVSGSTITVETMLNQPTRITRYLSDITLLASSTFSHEDLVGVPIQMASIDHSMWFHRVCRADQWLLYDQVSPNASNALGMSMGRIFQDGKLVATCAQEGLIRPRPDLLGGLDRA